MRKALFLFNPHAGKGKISSKLDVITDVLTKAGFLVTTYPTQSKGDAADKIKLWGNAFDRIVVAGGDGMLHEAINGIMALEQRPELGFIPSGTVNDFAGSHGLPKTVEKAVEVAAGDSIKNTDIGCMNGEFFSYVAAFGAITDIPYTTNQSSKNSFGFLAYLANALKYIDLKTLMRACREVTIKTDTETIEGEFLVGCVSNSKTIGSLKQLVPKDAELEDGLMEGLFVRKPNNLSDMNHALGLLIAGNMDAPGIISMKSGRFEITTKTEAEWTLDGEDGGSHTSVVIEDHKQALSMLMP